MGARIECRTGHRFGPGLGVQALGVVRAQRGGSFKPAVGSIEVRFEPVGAAHGEVDEGVQRIEIDPPLCALPRLRHLRIDVTGLAQECGLEVHERQSRMGAGEPRIASYGAAEHIRCNRIVFLVEAVQMLQAQMVGRPGVEIVRHL